MKTKRLVGRPGKGSDAIGPAKLVEATRFLLRINSIGEISRKAIAEAAGVTPALVSYHFPDQTELIRAAIRPVISDYLGRLSTVIDAERPTLAALKALIALFISFNKTEAQLLDNYLSWLRTNSEGTDERAAIGGAFERIARFFELLIVSEGCQAGTASWLVLATWGICKSVVQTPIMPFGINVSKEFEEEWIHEQTERVFALITAGRPSYKGVLFEVPSDYEI